MYTQSGIDDQLQSIAVDICRLAQNGSEQSSLSIMINNSLVNSIGGNSTINENSQSMSNSMRITKQMDQGNSNRDSDNNSHNNSFGQLIILTT